ncbi:MAG: SMC-Scp complex subunit ScpB [Chloroflexi bacterium]|nr:SMC-Scp complex subunit ScpB [Chloroflexota bacterium]
MDELTSRLESLLFVAAGPLAPAQLGQILGASPAELEPALVELDRQCRTRGIRLQQQPAGYLFVSAPENAATVERLLGVQPPARLSAAALETLAIIAYRQPITRASVEAIRGVNADRAIATLQARGLIEEAGRAETAGRPILWATTADFLHHFGLTGLTDLPPLPAEP